jgi:hypothetical protein
MEPIKINCFLCSNNEAKKYESVGASRNITVECPECTSYQVSDMAIMFFFERKNGKKLLEEHDNKKLIGYVKRHYEQRKEPLLITTDFIEKVTGKRSIHTSYK